MKTHVSISEVSARKLVLKKERLVNLAKSSKNKSKDITTTFTTITTNTGH